MRRFLALALFWLAVQLVRLATRLGVQEAVAPSVHRALGRDLLALERTVAAHRLIRETAPRKSRAFP